MTFDPSTDTRDITVLVVDKDHPRFGDIGRLIAHDWREYGIYHVEFGENDSEKFPDGLLKGEQTPVRIFYRHEDAQGKFHDSWDGSGFGGLKKEYLRLGVGDLASLVEKYKSVFGINPEDAQRA